MSDSRPIILKIGGSAITDKTGELAAKTEIINRLAEESKGQTLTTLSLSMEACSFGHPTALKYGLKEGYNETNPETGFAETHHVMTVLNGLVMDAMIWHEIPAVAIAPSSCFLTENGKIKVFDETVLKAMQKMTSHPSCTATQS